VDELVTSRHEAKIRSGAQPFLGDGEVVLAAIVARPRGWTQSMAGSIHVGAVQQGRAYRAADEVDFMLASRWLSR
jgi:hypothetical protein